MSLEISIVVPVFNSAQIIPELIERIEKAMRTGELKFELILTDDCSQDDSWLIICGQCKTKNYIKGIRLEQNKGQWISTLVGMEHSTGKYIVTIDDDLEYEPYEILKLYKSIKEGQYEIVYGMVLDKYFLQGKNTALSKWRKSLMHKLWNSPPTESFRILSRSIVFDNGIFLPTKFIDAFIVSKLDKQQIGYENVMANRRYAGISNVGLLKKIKLFLHYRLHFPLPFIWKLAGALLIVAVTCCLLYYRIYDEYEIILFALGLIGIVIAIKTFIRFGGLKSKWVISDKRNL